MVSTEIIDRIAFVTMQNGKHFNCLSEEMCEALSEAIQAAYKAECVGIVLKAEVNKVYGLPDMTFMNCHSTARILWRTKYPWNVCCDWFRMCLFPSSPTPTAPFGAERVTSA